MIIQNKLWLRLTLHLVWVLILMYIVHDAMHDGIGDSYIGIIGLVAMTPIVIIFSFVKYKYVNGCIYKLGMKGYELCVNFIEPTEMSIDSGGPLGKIIVVNNVNNKCSVRLHKYMSNVRKLYEHIEKDMSHNGNYNHGLLDAINKYIV